jgi:serine/threonine protein kinase
MIDLKKLNTENYYQDNIYENIDIRERISKPKEILKIPKDLFLYNNIDMKMKKEKESIIFDKIVFETENGRKILFSDEFTVKTKIGEGSFGQVYAVYDKSLKLNAALKIIEKNRLNEHNEKFYLKQSCHSNIVQFLRSLENEDYLILVMELMEGGSLKDLIIERYSKEGNSFFNEEECSLIIKGIVQGIDYLHEKKMIHRDIKPGIYYG